MRPFVKGDARARALSLKVTISDDDGEDFLYEEMLVRNICSLCLCCGKKINIDRNRISEIDKIILLRKVVTDSDSASTTITRMVWCLGPARFAIRL